MSRSFWVVLAALVLGISITWPPPGLSPALQDWKDSGSYFTFKEYQIFYKAETGMYQGDKAVVILHGFPSFSYDWVKIWDQLVENFSDVVVLDFLGFGFSDKPGSHNYSLFEQADITEALLKRLDIKNVHILAHDYGDTVAQELLARFEESGPEKAEIIIQSVCLTNGGIFPETNHPRPVQKLLLLPVLGPLLQHLTVYPVFKRGFGEVFGKKTKPTEQDFTDFWAGIRHKNGNLVTAGLLQYVNERWNNRDRWVGALQHSPVPVHMIYGPADPVNTSPGFVERYKSLIPSPSIDVLEDHISHYPQWEDPSGTMSSYMKFIKTVETKPAT